MKEKVLKISLICIIIVLAVFGFYKIANYEVSTASLEETSLGASGSGIGTLASGEKNPSGYSYNTHTGTFEAIAHRDWGMPIYGSFQIYCIQGGAQLRYANSIHYADALAEVGKTTTKTHTYKNGHASTPSSLQGKITYPVFTEVATGNLSPALAYIVSDEPIGSWSEEKQKAVWNTKSKGLDGGLVISDASSQKGPSIYDTEAENYANYDKTVRNKGLNPADQTSIDNITTKVNQDTKEYTVGPFNMTYTNGIYGNIAFSGISEMTVIGYNSQGVQVRDNIKIEKIILDGSSAVTPEYFEPSSNLKVDETNQVYPKSGQNFEIVFKDPNSGLSASDSNRVASISIKVKFKYMLANGQYTKLKGTRYTVDYNHTDSDYHVGHKHSSTSTNADGTKTTTWCDGHGCYENCKKVCVLRQTAQQYLAAMDAIRSIYEQEIILAKGTPVGITMDLGGHVWEDVPSGKENLADGKYSSGTDRNIPNVKVTLYESNGTVATLLSSTSEGTVTNRINPTYTNANGNYLFEGIDAMKQYYVQFEYNGQVYIPTTYSSGFSNTSSDWKYNSNGTEKSSDRNTLDSRFAEIQSAPVNYKSTNSLNSGALTNGYNESFSQYDLMGFEMTESGNYTQGTRLIDSFYKIENGNVVETNTIQEGVISQKIKQYVQSNKKYPDSSALRSIYSSIAGGNNEIWRKLQYIEDCKIKSYTKSQNGGYDLYPVYRQFVINKNPKTTFSSPEAAQNGSYNTSDVVKGGVTYKAIYPGQFFINQGLWRRQETDLSLRKDVVYAATRINGKTEVYTYDNRLNMTNEEKTKLANLRKIYEQDRTNLKAYNDYINYLSELEQKHGNDYWEIQVRMRDYNNYYATTYTRELYPSDYVYRGNATNGATADLELYVTYKITVRNTSTSIVSEIREIVDYYDKDYTYMDDLSWVMYKNNSGDDATNISVSKEDYYNSIDQLSLQGNLKNNAKDTKSNSNSRYGSASQQSGLESDYDVVYVRGLDSKKLASGEEAYVYLTFKVKSDGNGPVILDEDNSLKQNYAEINGYTTYYANGTKLPNYGNVGGKVAGIVDVDSTPGNLSKDDLSGNKYEKNFEDDTDRAKSLKITLNQEFIRSVNGNSWEDERTKTVSDSIIGDGVRQNGEITINGVTVELVEKLEGGKEYIWQTTQSGSGKGRRINLTTGQPEDYTYTVKAGYYEFSEAIPGNYIVRFKYGDKNDTVLTLDNGGKNTVSYNGQDFKSTVYQKDMNGSELAGYNDEYYDIQKSDAFGKNISDAKDIWSRREAVNSYSSSKVTNHIAEVLASPYYDDKTSPIKYSQEEYNKLINELIEKTNMTAETGIIVLEGEYNRTTDGYSGINNGSEYLYDNDLNGNYTLNNVDLGLTERPKAQLELTKKVTNVKVTLANGTTLFDTSKSATDITWTSGTPYDIINEISKGKYEEYYTKDHRYAYRDEIYKIITSKYSGMASNGNGLINITMDDELMHGATIKVSYEITVTNAGETDYTGQDFYYKGTSATNISTTTANVVLDYVSNNLQFRTTDNSTDGWTTVDNVISSKDINAKLTSSIEKYNTVIETGNLGTALKPGESTKAGLILSQLMTAENTSDDRKYTNISEITTISNTVGRRMAFSIQGNQDPTEMPQEVDSSKAEKIIVLPPTGIGTIITYIVVSIVALAVLIGGIILIKKKVLKK